jgi:hypothetical protein
MSMRKRMLLYSGLACTVLVLAATTAAAAATGPGAGRVAVDVPPGYVTESTDNLSLPNNTDEGGTVTCPQGTVVLSGGAYIASTSVKAGINSSFPENNRTWTAYANNFSGAATTFNVYAVCATKPKGYVRSNAAGPVSNPAGQQDSAAISCPAGDVLFGGGAAARSHSVSVAMTSSYPQDSTSWTVAVSNFSTSGETFTVHVICGKAFPGYAIAATSASDPAGVQKGIVQHCAATAVVLGGGNQSSNTTNLRIQIKASQPFPASGTSWKAGENNDTTAGTTLTAYAICAT